MSLITAMTMSSYAYPAHCQFGLQVIADLREGVGLLQIYSSASVAIVSSSSILDPWRYFLILFRTSTAHVEDNAYCC